MIRNRAETIFGENSLNVSYSDISLRVGSLQRRNKSDIIAELTLADAFVGLKFVIWKFLKCPEFTSSKNL